MKGEKFSEMSDEKLFEYGKIHGLYGLSPGELEKRDIVYYTLVIKRGLEDNIFKRKK